MILPAISILGILGMTLLFPLLAAVAATAAGTRRSSSPLVQAPANVAILIPAHNEESLLADTLRSIKNSIDFVGRASSCTFRVIVGADGCTDCTENVAQRANAEILRMPAKTGKWGTMSALVKVCSETDWIILADCGVEWSDDFLSRFLSLTGHEETIAIAPLYRNDSSGFLEKIIWATEGAIKRIEARSGGPVSVHGATVCYRTKELCCALDFLSHERWINDDVVIPLTLRALYPTKRIEYLPSLSVKELPKQCTGERNEFRRRLRLVHGNIQWITLLWSSIWKRNQVAALIACRRVFRLVWAYWAGLSTLSLAYYASAFNYTFLTLLLMTPLGVGALFLKPQLRNLFQSGVASALAPYYFIAATLRPSTPYQELQWS